MQRTGIYKFQRTPYHTEMSDQYVENCILGFIPSFIYSDEIPLQEQFNKTYAHGGGWNKFDGFAVGPDMVLRFPGDPPLAPVCFLELPKQSIYVYQHGWVAIKTGDAVEVARMD